MPRGLVPLHARRDLSNAASLQRRVQLLETRMDAAVPAQAGVIDPAYTTGDPRVTVGADAALTGPYKHLSSYTPVAGDTVALQWTAGTWVILGRLA